MTATAVQAIPFTRPAGTRALSVERITDQWGFSALRHDWNDLLRASAADNPFLTWEWLHSWWRHEAGTSALHLLAVRSGSELVAVAPLRMTAGPLAWFSTLEFLGNGGAGSDYLDLIVHRGREADAVRAIVQQLRTGDACLAPTAVRFDHVLPQSAAALAAGQLTEHGWITSVTPGGVCPTVHLGGHTWDSYLATLGAAHRANVRRRLRAIDKQFDARFELVTTDGERRQAMAALIAFHRARFGDRGSAFLTPELRAFHDEATGRLLERGWLRLYTLRLNGAIAAVMYGFFYHRRFYFFQHGFDDHYKAQSIGLVLMAMTIRAAIDEHADEFDMLWGTEAYKSLWADDRRLLQQIHLFPAHVGGRVHRRALDARRRLGRLARRVLPGGVTSAT